MILCNCGGRRARLQAIDAAAAQAIVDQQAQVAPLTASSTIVDPDELVPDIR